MSSFYYFFLIIQVSVKTSLLLPDSCVHHGCYKDIILCGEQCMWRSPKCYSSMVQGGSCVHNTGNAGSHRCWKQHWKQCRQPQMLKTALEAMQAATDAENSIGSIAGSHRCWKQHWKQCWQPQMLKTALEALQAATDAENSIGSNAGSHRCWKTALEAMHSHRCWKTALEAMHSHRCWKQHWKQCTATDAEKQHWKQCTATDAENFVESILYPMLLSPTTDVLWSSHVFVLQPSLCSSLVLISNVIDMSFCKHMFSWLDNFAIKVYVCSFVYSVVLCVCSLCNEA